MKLALENFMIFGIGYGYMEYFTQKKYIGSVTGS